MNTNRVIYIAVFLFIVILAKGVVSPGGMSFGAYAAIGVLVTLMIIMGVATYEAITMIRAIEGGSAGKRNRSIKRNREGNEHE